VHDYFNKNQIFIKKVYDFSDVDGISGHWLEFTICFHDFSNRKKYQMRKLLVQ
jgi:hypothetical protein